MAAVLDAIAAGTTRMSVKAPTGSGKTVIMMYLIHKLWKAGNHSQQPTADRERGQVLILVPNVDLVTQVKDAATSILRGQLGHRCLIEVEQGDWRSDGCADLCVACSVA